MHPISGMALFFVLSAAFVFDAQSQTHAPAKAVDTTYQPRKKSFKKGEEIVYKIHYGFLNAAEAKMHISDELHTLNGRPCYKIDIYGTSIGMFDLFLRIRDNWGTYLDTAAIIPHRSYRKIEEGRYRRREVIDFDPVEKKASVKVFHNKKNEWKPTEYFEVPHQVQDIVSGYYFLRTLDFKTLKPGDIVTIAAFFDKEIYHFKIRFDRRETIKTKLGEIRSLVLSPLMPENSLFDGENSIQVWISDDINKVPLKIKAQMFVGAVEIDITSYQVGKE